MACLLAGRGNLLQNPGFEDGLTSWVAENVIVDDSTPPEGTHAARLGTGVASLFQDVPLGLCPGPLLVSFIAYTTAHLITSGNVVAQVLWLDASHNEIGTGLRTLLASNVIDTNRITYFDVTDRPPRGASWARLLLSKGGDSDSPVALDQLLLTAVETPNLVRNPGFELGLQDWLATTFTADFANPFTGLGNARRVGETGTLQQDVSLGPARPRATYLLSFAAQGSASSMLTIQLIWLNGTGEPIGAGIDLFVPEGTLGNQQNYLSFLLPSEPTPLGTVRARILFTADSAAPSSVDIDQVLLVRIATANLVQNSGFADGLDQWSFVNTSVQTGTAYLGTHYALLGADGGALFQTVPLPALSLERTFLFSFALFYPNPANTDYGDLTAELRWLDAAGRDLGLGASVIVPLILFDQRLWLVYAVVTERAPMGAAAALVQFTKADGSLSGSIGVDHVVLARLV